MVPNKWCQAPFSEKWGLAPFIIPKPFLMTEIDMHTENGAWHHLLIENGAWHHLF